MERELTRAAAQATNGGFPPTADLQWTITTVGEGVPMTVIRCIGIGVARANYCL
jgi:hypothetical protein